NTVLQTVIVTLEGMAAMMEFSRPTMSFSMACSAPTAPFKTPFTVVSRPCAEDALCGVTELASNAGQSIGDLLEEADQCRYYTGKSIEEGLGDAECNAASHLHKSCDDLHQLTSHCGEQLCHRGNGVKQKLHNIRSEADSAQNQVCNEAQGVGEQAKEAGKEGGH
ncbi:hypothetical protein TYRP_014794, partial [Tyrophagus putrescentiae]